MSVEKAKISSLKLDVKQKFQSQCEKVWLLNLDQIEQHSGRVISKEYVNISEIGNSTHYFSKGTVLYSKLRPYLNKVVITDEDGFATTELVPINCDVTKVNPEYLAYFLRSEIFLTFATNVVAGAKMPRMVMGEFWSYEIPLPPLPEQRRIASILDKADELRQKRQQTIEKLDQLLQAEFISKFHQKNYPEFNVSDLLENEKSMRTGPFGSQLLHSEFVDEGIHVLGIDNAVQNSFNWAKPRFITEEKYKDLKRYTVKPRDVIITIMGTCGKCAVVPEDIPTAINTKHLCCITLDQRKCNPEFLHSYFLLHPTARNYLESRAKGAIMSGLNMGIIKELPVELPPIEMQNEFSKLKQKVMLQKTLMIVGLSKLNELFKSLQNQAFRGTL